MIRHLLILLFALDLVSWAQVTVHPTDDVPRIVSSKPAGTTFVFTPGTYRLSQSIIPKDNDQFIGQASCAPPATSCPAIISGGVVIGPAWRRSTAPTIRSLNKPAWRTGRQDWEL